MDKNIGRQYDDIINLPHHKSETRRHMPIIDRAAQFAPFAALTGHSEVIKETARRTEERIELDEYEKYALNEKLCSLKESIAADKSPMAEFVYFVPDERKPGGAYVSVSGNVKKIREFEHIVIMQDGTEIPIDEILNIIA